MKLSLVRRWFTEASIIGTLEGDGEALGYILERPEVAIPADRFRVILTPSARAQAGTLWSPRPDHLLPLVDGVPGREGIRFHAGNVPADTDGCLITGTARHVNVVYHSRIALIALMARLGGPGDWLEITEAPE